MKRKNLCIALAAVLIVSAMAAGCAKKQPAASASPSAAASGQAQTASPTATPNAKIRNTEGSVLNTEEPGVEGPVLALSEDKMDVKVADETYSFVLGENAKRDLSLFNKNPEQPRIMEGTQVIVYYEESGKKKIAKSIEILESN